MQKFVDATESNKESRRRMVELLLDEWQWCLNDELNPDGETLLSWAVKNGHVSCFEMLMGPSSGLAKAL